MASPTNIPDFDSLPKVEGMPQGCTWGLWDKDGKKDLLGTLNLLTPDVVKAAASEVKEGVSISLNWPLNGIKFPFPGRDRPTHKVEHLTEKNENFASEGWDDELAFNTQISSQWDSLVHYQHQASGLAYNGVRVSRNGLLADSTAANANPTLDHWHARGCLVARGVLVDYARYADEVAGAPLHPFEGTRVTAAQLEACAAHQGVAFRPGDVLVVRTGFTELLDGPPSAADFGLLARGTVSGVHGAEETARWLWDRRFAAVAGDGIAFEALPGLGPDGAPGGPRDLVLHSWLLSMFGMSIGELWDLKALSAHCKRTGRYSFMLTSAPLNHPGLVGSPPNALAIF